VAAARFAESRELAVASSNDSAAVSKVSPRTEKTVDGAALVFVAMDVVDFLTIAAGV
jgi:hypothetical protein